MRAGAVGRLGKRYSRYPREGMGHSTYRKKVDVAPARTRPECKSNTENVERTQMFTLRWEEIEAQALDGLDSFPQDSVDRVVPRPLWTRQKVGSNGIMSK